VDQTGNLGNLGNLGSRGAPEEDSDVRVVRAAYAAFARADIEAAVADLHPDVEWIEPDEFPNGGRHLGRDAVRRYLKASRSTWRELRSVATVTRRGERIIAEHHLEGVLPDGTAHQATVADVFTLRGGLVVHMQAYADPDDVPA
jgi:ketosteroid isomerase-like protein